MRKTVEGQELQKSVKKEDTTNPKKLNGKYHHKGKQKKLSSEDTPAYLIPRMGELPISEVTHFQTAHFIADHKEAEVKTFGTPLKVNIKEPSGQRPVSGVLLSHEQNWYTRGLSFGNLLHSLTLAPGEVTQVAVQEWHRDEHGDSSESTSQDDTSSAKDKRNRAINEIQNSTANEVQSGHSSATSVGASMSGGASSPFASASASVNASHACSTNYSDGNKDVALSENQRINETTVRSAKASRARRASKVLETSQSEGEQLTTRVVANYNHAHALTMMYFEAIEAYEVKTKVVQAERLIYLPMEVSDIDRDMLLRFKAQLSQATKMRGNPELSDKIEVWYKNYISYNVDSREEAAFTLERPSGFTKIYDGFRRPVPPTGCYSLGDIALSDRDKNMDDNGISCSIIRPLNGYEGIVKQPKSFEKIWDDGTPARDGNPRKAGNFSFWRPVPPIGFVSLGICVSASPDTPPPLDSVRCVSQDLVLSAKSGVQISSIKADEDATTWQVTPSDLAKGLDCGTFVVKHGMHIEKGPTKDGVFHCLNQEKAREYVQLQNTDLNQILSHLNSDRLFYNQVIWMAQEPQSVTDSLRAVKWPSTAKVPLSALVDPRPVTFTGNYVGYRWNFEEDGIEKETFLKKYLESEDEESKSHTVSIGVPTGGIFGEAVLGQSVSAEKIDLTRFWKWQDSMIPILPTKISPLKSGTRARDIDTSTGKLNDSAATLDQLNALPDPAGFSAVSQMMTGNMFRDMSGSSIVKDLALSANEHAANSSDNAGKLASENYQAYLGYMENMAQMQQQSGMDTTTFGGMQNQNKEKEEGLDISDADDSISKVGDKEEEGLGVSDGEDSASEVGNILTGVKDMGEDVPPLP